MQVTKNILLFEVRVVYFGKLGISYKDYCGDISEITPFTEKDQYSWLLLEQKERDQIISIIMEL